MPDIKCIFCEIVRDRSTEFIYEDDDFVSFKDIKPAATHHYLVIPKRHVGNPSTLNYSDMDLVKQLLSVAEEILRDKNADYIDARYGYHWPPFNSVPHLHLHVISPASEMNFMNRLVFKPDSYWFITAQKFIENLEKMKEPTDDSGDTDM